MVVEKFVDLYKTLSVSPSATGDQIRAAFYKLAKLCHPDVATTGSVEKFKRINEAYQVLSTKRKAYDLEYSAHFGRSQGASSSCSKGSSETGTANANNGSRYQTANHVREEWNRAWTRSPWSSHSSGRFSERCEPNQRPATRKSHFYWSDYGNDDEEYEDCEDQGYSSEERWSDESESDAEEMTHRFEQRRRSARRRQGDRWMRGKYKNGRWNADIDAGWIFDQATEPFDEAFEVQVNRNGRIEFITVSQTYGAHSGGKSRKHKGLHPRILQRIRQSPRPEDEALLRQFGLNPRKFGFPPHRNGKSVENMTFDQDDHRERRSTKPSSHSTSKARRSVSRNAAETTDASFDSSDSRYEEASSDTGDTFSDIAYDFETNTFQWSPKGKDTESTPGQRRQSTNKRRASSLDSTKESVESETADNGSASSSASPPAVAVYTLASKYCLGKHRADRQPVLQVDHKLHGNKVEQTFFLNKPSIARWLKRSGDRKRLYAVFKNGSLQENYRWSKSSKTWGTETTGG